MAPRGLRRSGGSSAGCCDNSFGGFDKEEDDITRAEREDREKQHAKETKIQEKSSHLQPTPQPIMVITPPTPPTLMTVEPSDVGGPTHEIIDPKVSR